jgi:hypothetical protein
MRIRDGKNSDPESGMEKIRIGIRVGKIRIWDKQPGSATLQKNYISTFMKMKKFLTWRVQREVMTQLELRRFP